MKSLLVVILIVTSTVSAQITTFNGKILDQETKQPIQYAHVSFNDHDGVGVSTTKTGDFTLVVEQNFLDSKVLISCLSYQDTLVSTQALQDKSFYLKPKVEFLQEVVIGKSEDKEISIGTLKGKKRDMLSKRNITMLAQFIKTSNKDKSCNYLKNVAITFKKNWHSPARARIRILSKDAIKGTPKDDLLTKSIIITISQYQTVYNVDLSELYIEVPEEGFFVAVEKLIIPLNMTFIATIERSTYPKYVVKFNKDEDSDLNKEDKEQKQKLMSFEKYKTEVSHYAPTIDLTEKKSKHSDYGKLYQLNANKWEIYNKEDTDYIMPVQVILSN